MRYIKVILLMAIILIGGWKFHEYDEKNGDKDLWQALLWFGIEIAIGTIIIFCIPS